MVDGAAEVVHVGAIALWAGGLLVLPLLLARRARLASHDAVQGLHALTRRLVLWFMSPGAFVAVGTGTALIFLRPTQAPWFSAKLAAVGLMAALHVAQSTLVLRLFRPGERVAAWRLGAAGLANAAVVLLILLLVLAKPGWRCPAGAATGSAQVRWVSCWVAGLTRFWLG